jgi:asparagine synthase (glutamine-hydrolysing)
LGMAATPLLYCEHDHAALPPVPPHLAIAADSQLQNRKELSGALGIHSISCSDARLIMAGWEKWGEAVSDFLLGDFVFAIWDDSKRRLFCCRDHLGSRPFFYWSSGSRLVFASNREFILNVPGVSRELNRRKLASMATAMGQNFFHDETFFRGIMSLPAGASLTADRNGTRVRNYWTPKLAPGPVLSDEAAIETLADLLRDSVGKRIDCPGGPRKIGALLSGGLDSSSVVSLAARHLAKSNLSLSTFAIVLPEENRKQLTDEREYIDEFRSWPNVEIEYITAPGGGPFDHIENSDRFRTRFVHTSRFYLYEAIREAATARGCEVMLDGAGGELGATNWGDQYHLELALGLKWGTMFHELRELRKTRGVAPLKMLGSQILTALAPQRDQRSMIMLQREFARECEARPPKRHWPGHRRSQLGLIQMWLNSHAGDRGQMVLGHLRFQFPFVDKRIIEFCLGAPGRLKVRDGYQRYMIRRALDGILPPRIQWRTTKFPFSPDYYIRYNKQIGKARSLVNAIGPRDPVRAIVDVEKLRTLVHPVDPVKGTWAALVSVPATIYLICFLRQFPDYRL